MEKFSYFLLNEEKSYLGHRVGDVLTSVQELEDDMENLGSRQLMRFAEEIVNQIRKIIHGNWKPRYMSNLKELQKIAVAIQRTVDDKGDLRSMLPAVTQSLQELSNKLGVKVNDVEAPEIEDQGEDISVDDLQSTGPMPSFKDQKQMPQGEDQMPQNQM